MTLQYMETLADEPLYALPASTALASLALVLAWDDCIIIQLQGPLYLYLYICVSSLLYQFYVPLLISSFIWFFSFNALLAVAYDISLIRAPLAIMSLLVKLDSYLGFMIYYCNLLGLGGKEAIHDRYIYRWKI